MKKGFTLIELLSVIVILAVLAIVTIPIISGVIETTKKSALKESANALVEEAGYYYMQYGVDNNVRFDIENNEINKVEGNTLLFKGNVKDATVLINIKGEVALCINDGNYSVYKNYSDSKLIEVDNKNCNIPTGQAVVFLDNESTITEYTNQELTSLVIALQQKITELENKSSDATPAGTVISYIAGSTAPEGYLPCDGTVYNIADYPVLANAIKNGLGSYNYYGGDGTTTFAVPDLRGEFLRGTGTNSKATTSNTYGTGSSVGGHQEATIFPYYGATGAGKLTFYTNGTNANYHSGRDKLYYANSIQAFAVTGTSYTASITEYAFTPKPTNTSVLYCIKY